MIGGRELRYWTDKAGIELVSLKLGNVDQEAVLLRSDFEALQKIGLSYSWSLTDTGYVIASERNAKGRQVTVSRCILGAGPGQTVRFRDGDKLNLRRENLVLIEGGSALRRDRDLVSPRRGHVRPLVPGGME